MKKWFLLIVICMIVLVQFQNCSPSHISGEGNGFALSSIYPYYSSKPQFFESVQLTELVNESGIWKYQFVATIVYIEDPSQDINVEIQIFDGENNILCPRTTLTVNQNTNHIVIDNCQSSSKVDQAKVSMSAKLNSDVSGVLQNIKDYIFDIE